MNRTKIRVAVLAATSLAVGVGLIWWSSTIDPPWSVVVATIGTIIPTIGIVNLVSDVFLQKSISDDLVDLIQADRRLVESGVDEISPIADVDWSQLIRSDKEVKCFILDADQFRVVIWPRLLEAAKDRLQTIELILPLLEDPGLAAESGMSEQLDPPNETLATKSAVIGADGSQEKGSEVGPLSARSNADFSTTAELARRFGMDEARYRGAQHDLATQVEADWKAMKARWKTPCSLTIRYGSQFPRYAFVRTPRRVAIGLQAVSASSDYIGGRAIVFRTERKGALLATWLTDSIDSLESTYTAPLFSDARPASGFVGGL